MRALHRITTLLLAACVGPRELDPPHSDSDAPVDSPADSPADSDPPAPSPTSTLTASGVRACADPSQRQLALYDRLTVQRAPALSAHLEGSGSAVGDLDGDGLPDLVVVLQTEVLLLRHAELLGGGAIEVLLTEPAATAVTGLFGASAADYDDDGDLDLLITGRGVADHLLHNDGAGQFTDRTAAAGLTHAAEHHTTSASWSDFDHDGDLDLFLGGHGYVDEQGTIPAFAPGEPSLLYRNLGVGQFEDVSALLPDEVQGGYTFLGGWFDADLDGDDDLYMVNDFGGSQRPCSLVLNDGGTFRADNGASGIDAAVSGMGLAIGDLDGDGLEDLAIPAWRRHVLYQRREGAWFDVAQLVGFTADPPQTVAWGSELVDVDNNGLLDLATPFGYLETGFGDNNEREQRDAMFVQVEPNVLRDQARFGGGDDAAPHRSVNPSDLNRDGWPDLVKVGLDGVVRVDLSRCGEQAWLSVTLRQPAPNMSAIGATVQVRVGAHTWRQRLRLGGTGYGTSKLPELHFGLASHDAVDELTVTWPDGFTETWRDLPTRQHLAVSRSVEVEPQP